MKKRILAAIRSALMLLSATACATDGDNADKIITAGIPLALVCGDSEMTVPYIENGIVMFQKYQASGLPFFEVLKPGCGHHPHGLEDNTALI